MRGAHYQLSVGTFSSCSSFPTIHFLQGNYGDACCNIFQVKKVFLFYVTYFLLGFITRVIFCLCMYSLWRKISGTLPRSSLDFSYYFKSRDCVKETSCSACICRLVCYQDDSFCRIGFNCVVICKKSKTNSTVSGKQRLSPGLLRHVV